MNRNRGLVILVSLLVSVALAVLTYQFREILPIWALGAIVGLPLFGGLVASMLIKEEAPPLPPPAPKEEKPPEKETPPPPEPVQAAQISPEAYVASFLGVLQREGRFLDFLNENLEAYDDAQIGAAVRTIHRGLKTAVFEMVHLEPVVKAQEGAEMVIEEDFNPKEIKLIGQVKGRPPFRGILRHPGWRYQRMNLPKPREDRVLAPAEVEIP